MNHGIVLEPVAQPVRLPDGRTIYDFFKTNDETDEDGETSNKLIKLEQQDEEIDRSQ